MMNLQLQKLTSMDLHPQTSGKKGGGLLFHKAGPIGGSISSNTCVNP